MEKAPLDWPAIEIKPIQQYQVEVVKRVILTVVRKLYRWEVPLVEILNQFDERGELSDIDDFRSYYFKRQGLFLVVTNNDQVIGSGAVGRIDNNICELKRLWLLEEYQGKGIGYRILRELIYFARTSVYTKLWYESEKEQERAIQFY